MNQKLRKSSTNKQVYSLCLLKLIYMTIKTVNSEQLSVSLLGIQQI